jgi:acyl-CoA dehydrogenase
VIEGEKTFITSGLRADWITLAAPASPAGARAALDDRGARPQRRPHAAAAEDGLALLGRRSCIRRRARAARHRLGEEGQGFRIIMGNFNAERFGMSAAALGFSEACFDEALAWARQPHLRGRPGRAPGDPPKLVDMQMRIQSTAAWLEALAARADAGDTGADWVAQVCLLKNHSTQAMQFCADQAVQILGMGLHARHGQRAPVPRGQGHDDRGGAEEIMKDLGCPTMGPMSKTHAPCPRPSSPNSKPA